jgi:hypothetical protein
LAIKPELVYIQHVGQLLLRKLTGLAQFLESHTEQYGLCPIFNFFPAALATLSP